MEDKSNVTAIIDNLKLDGYKRRKIYIWGVIDESVEFLVNYAFDRLYECDLEENCVGQYPISIHINSPGGSVPCGLSIIGRIEQFKKLGYEVITHCYGEAGSAAFFIFICGSKRIALPHSQFLIHQPISIGSPINNVEDIKRIYSEMDNLWKRMREITKKYTKLDDVFLDRLSDTNSDELLWAEEALELGIVDTIV